MIEINIYLITILHTNLDLTEKPNFLGFSADKNQENQIKTPI